MPALFQTFDATSDLSKSHVRIEALRAALRRQSLDGFLVPHADEHQSEYLPACAERLSWLTGFTGSAGTAIVLQDRMALIVDGRYTLQAAAEIDTSVVVPVLLSETPPHVWIEAHLGSGKSFAIDPALHTPKGIAKIEDAVAKAGSRLLYIDNPIDTIWTDRPPAPQKPLRLHALVHAGESIDDKLSRIRAKLEADALLVSDPANLAWAFNLRGEDIAHTPLALGYALMPIEEKPILFFDSHRVSPDVEKAFQGKVVFRSAASLFSALDALGAKQSKIRLDASTASLALKQQIESAGGFPDLGPDPITALKAVKNAVEIEGARQAHRRDGAAVTRFLAWLDRQAPSNRPSEIDAVEKLEEFRRETGALKDISFPTIAGSGSHGAIVHYRVTRATDRPIENGTLFLIDSGGQYEDGTTDITRTIAIGEPSEEMKRHFTLVLKGHIALADAVFPEGTTGAQLDTLARLPLWKTGVDFEHGTGHGVGSYLSVHEGPQRISKWGTTPLEPGMILSNEPGYYKAGAYGIRIENLILVEWRKVEGAEKTMLGFETLTLAPIDRRLIDKTLLSADETEWLNDYHARVESALSPLMNDETKVWLREATLPL